MKKNINEGWRTTTIGIILFLVAIGYILLNATPDYILVSILLAVGIAMLFFPDNLLQNLKNLIKNKSK